MPDSAELSTADLPNELDVIENGKIVAFSNKPDPSTFNFNGQIKLMLNNPFPLNNNDLSVSTPEITSFTEVAPAKVNLIFHINESITERNSYIATDRQTSIYLPFGAFPGTKKF